MLGVVFGASSLVILGNKLKNIGEKWLFIIEIIGIMYKTFEWLKNYLIWLTKAL